VLGIAKAYTTRVGMGPFPTEFDAAFSEHIRKLGGEYGATTGRPRRCGWLDMVVLRMAVMVNGLTDLAITKLDVLDSLDKIKICTGYRTGGRELEHYPAELDLQERVQPIYETHPGWNCSTQNARTFADLPANAQSYLKRIEELAGVPLSIISVGSRRNQTIIL